MSRREGNRTLVFAKAPQPGRAKTRLIPALGEAGAAQLHGRLVYRAIRTALGAEAGDVELCCAPDRDHPFFACAAAQFPITLAGQVGHDLGARMANALRHRLGQGNVVLIGSDCPALASADIRAAYGALEGGADAVFVPAEDGGYVLIGLRRFDFRVFSGIEWGTDQVMRTTRARLAQVGWRWRELGTLWDVDRPEDLERLAQARLLNIDDLLQSPGA